MSTLRPFERPRFEDIPDLPRKPHPFFTIPDSPVSVQSPHFGTIRLSTRRFGKGPPLVCVHGLMTSSYSFRYLLEPLGARFELVVFDLPGAGRSDAPDVSYGPREVADLIGDTIETLGLRGCPVIGNSMGGYLCMWLAMRRPEVMGRLVNLHSPGLATFRNNALEVAFGFPGAERILDGLVRHDPERWVFRNVHYYDESLKSREETREYAAPLSTPAGRKAFAHYLADTLAASEMRLFERAIADLDGRFPIPLRLVYARRDPMVPPVVGERLARLLPSADMVWLEAASHFAHVDATDAFVHAVLPFLDRT